MSCIDWTWQLNKRKVNKSYTGWTATAIAIDLIATYASGVTVNHVAGLGVIDQIIKEPLGGAHRDPHTAAHNLEQFVAKTLRDLKRCKLENLLERRYEKFRNLGNVAEATRRQAGKAAGNFLLQRLKFKRLNLQF